MQEQGSQLGELELPSRRQATNAIRGYYYQLLRTLDKWMSLRDDDILFVEGAEDFDIIRKDSYEANQVKALSAKITLNSVCVQEAIKNYWELRNKHSQISVYLKLITTARITVERDSPFGTGRGCLDVWNQISSDSEELELLVSYLRKRDWIPNELRKRIAETDVRTVFSEVVSHISWETSSPGPQFTKELIENRIILLGDRYGILPSESLGAIAPLLEHCLKTATLKHSRHLKRTDFLRLFEELTTESVPKAEIRRLRNQASNPAVVVDHSTGNPVELLLLSMAQPNWVSPLFQAEMVNRKLIIKSVLDKSKQTRIACIIGSSGMGKTIIAAQIQHQLMEKGEWYWVHCGFPQKSAFLLLLNALLKTILSTDGRPSIVLDDLHNDMLVHSEIESIIGSIIQFVRDKGGLVVITSQKPPFQRLVRKLCPSSLELTQVPLFNEAEIVEFATNLGCPQETLTATYRRILLLQSKGHPQLLHARLLKLKTDGWPPLLATDILSIPPEIAREKSEVRSLILGQLPQEHRDLVYRLGILSHLFRKDHAIAIASIEPQLSNPGDVFDAIVGPWVEPVGQGEYYRTSPLVSDIASDIFSVERVRDLHAKTAEAILQCKELTTLDGANIFFHAWMGRNESALFRISMSILTAKEKVRKGITSNIEWLMGLGTTGEGAVYPANSSINFIIRSIQFRMCVDFSPDKGINIITRWEQDVDRNPDKALRSMEKTLFATQVLNYYQVPIGARKVIKLLDELVRQDNVPSVVSGNLPTKTLDIGKNRFAIGDINFVETLSSFTVLRVNGIGWLREFFEALAEVDEESRNRILQPYIDLESGTRLLFGRAWSKELEKGNPDWNGCIKTFEFCAELSLQWKKSILAAHAYRAISVILDDYVGDRDGALARIDAALSSIGEIPFLLDQKAMVLSNLDRHERAIRIWLEVLPKWHPPTAEMDPLPALESRNAAISASRIEQWQIVIEFLDLGQNRMREMGKEIMSCGFTADSAYASWKVGDHNASIAKYRNCLEILDRHEKDEAFEVHAMKKMLGHSLLWLYNTSTRNDSGGLAEPFVGMCSNPNMSEGLRELPPSPLDITWAHLYGLALNCKQDLAGVQLVLLRLRNSRYSTARFIAEIMNVEMAFDKMAFRELASDGARLSVASSVAKIDYDAGKQIWEPSPLDILNQDRKAEFGDDIKSLLVGAVVIAVLNSTDWQPLIPIWRNHVDLYISPADFNVWLNEMERHLALDHYEALREIKAGTSCWEWATLCSAMLIQEAVVDPSILFWAHINMFTSFSRAIAKKQIFRHLAPIIERQWLLTIEQPALLMSPRITIPPIQSACISKSIGLAKYAEILLQARHSVNVRLPDVIVSDLKKWAKSIT